MSDLSFLRSIQWMFDCCHEWWACPECDLLKPYHKKDCAMAARIRKAGDDE